MTGKLWVVVAAAVVAVGVLVVGLTAGADTRPQAVTCQLTSGTLTCPIPQVTTTVAGPTVTKTVTVSPSSSSSSPVPSSSAPTSSAPPTSSSSSPPPAGGFPDASTTGVPAGTVLKTVTGNLTVAAGQTASGLDITGAVVLQAGATLAKSRVRCVGEDSWCVTMAAKTSLVDSEVGGGANGTTYGYAAGVWTGDFDTSADRNLILRDNIHHLTRAVQLDGQTTVQDSYFHDSAYDCVYHDTNPAGRQECDVHSSAVFMSKGHGITLEHNTMQDGSTAIVFGQVYDNDGSSLGNVLIDGNRFRAVTAPNGYTSSFAVSVEFKHIDQPATIRITDNVADAGPWDIEQYRHDSDDGTKGYTVTGNTTVPAGSPINP